MADDAVLEVGEFRHQSGIEIYEVVRIVDGVPLFLEDHLTRFAHSAWLCRLENPPGGAVIRRMLKKLMDVNGVFLGNIRLSWCSNPSGKLTACFIPHAYPDHEMINRGVSCNLLKAERHDPNAKVTQPGLREQANRLKDEKGSYEILLVNQQGTVTEGSRSNVFFLKEGRFFTAPDGEVLPGITRQKVLDILFSMGFPVQMLSLPVESLPDMDGVFLTGTSPKVLPVSKIDNLVFTVGHPAIRQLMTAYDDLIEQYIKNSR